MSKNYILRFNEPAENGLGGWVNRSFMLGNGYFGANIFGGVSLEKISFSEHTLSVRPTRYINERYCAGNECFAFLNLDFPHNQSETTDYVRTLCLNTGIATVNYTFGGVKYTREHFTSHADHVFVMRLCSDQKASVHFKLRPRIAYKREYLVSEGDGRKKTGTVKAINNHTLALEGLSESYNMEFYLYATVITDGGTVISQNSENNEDTLCVQNADSAYIILSLGTNYDLSKVDFNALDQAPLHNCPSRREEIYTYIQHASAYTYDQLLARHLKDFQTKFERVMVDWGGVDDGRPTNVLLNAYKNGEHSVYLEETHFQLGRYMLLSASREDGLPANLQGIWNMYDYAPWSCGYVYNINIQMNYWPAFVCNLKECFLAYHHFNKARFESCKKLADTYIKAHHPEHYEEGNNGWIVGAGNGALRIGMVGGHSGPGTGGLTTKAYWDFYEYTQDKSLLAKEIYPFLEEVTRFYVKCAENIDGKMLVTHSFSPEQKIDGIAYETVGCAFDQQMMYEANRNYIRASEILGLDSEYIDKELYQKAKEQIMLYDPVQIGASGQIKEYREETYYGEIGEKDHRHISQLVGAFPGTLLGNVHPAWSDAVKETVRLRGLYSGKAWSKVHKMLVLARNNGEKEAFTIAEDVLSNHVFDNLWNDHCGLAIFQADANFGIAAGYAELMLQSHADYLTILPYIPYKWKCGSFEGLCARGNFEVSAFWAEQNMNEIRIISYSGNTCKIKDKRLAHAIVTDDAGNIITSHYTDDDILYFDTSLNKQYIITNIDIIHVCTDVQNLNAAIYQNQVHLSWKCDVADASFTIYKAEDSSPTYTIVAEGITESTFTDTTTGKRTTYKVTAKTTFLCESEGTVLFVSCI